MCIMSTCVYVCICSGCDEMENIAPRAEFKPTSLAFWASVLSRFPWGYHPTHAYLYMQLLPERSVQPIIYMCVFMCVLFSKTRKAQFQKMSLQCQC